MPTTDQDARALTYLARRLRAETHGARAWDEAGTYTAVVKYVGQNLAETVERITRHAADPEARTPGAIARPFVPEAKPVSRRDDVPTHLRCSTCFKPRVDCERVRFADDDHGFEPATADHKRGPEQMRQIVVAAKGELAPTKPPPEPAEQTPDPRADVAREAMTTPPTHAEENTDA